MEKLTKICTKCNCEKELTDFLFRKDTQNYRNDCKKCLATSSRERRLKNIDTYRIRENSYTSLNREARANYCKGYWVINKDTISKKQKDYRVSNKEHISKYNKLYRQTENGKASRKNSHQKRRTKFKSGDVNTEQLKQLYINTKNCYWCNCKLEKDDTHLDHFYPLSKGGKHTINNLVLSCSSCNLSKATKHPIDFAKELDIIPYDLEFIL